MYKQSAVGIAQPFKINLTFPDPVRQALFNLVASPLEHAFGLAALNHLYANLVEQMRDDRNFLEKVLAILDVHYRALPEDLARIPKTGPVVVVSNHPFGGLDGIILAALLRSVRPDVKVMANHLLARIPDLAEYMIYVDPFGGNSAVRRNIRAVKSAIAWVRNGGLLTVFPSGEVSHIDLHKLAIIDPPWSPTIARIVRHGEAPVLPVFFGGSNSTMFNILGLVHPLLRTAMLPREFLNKRRQMISVQIGNLVSFSKLATFRSDEDMTAYLRLRTYLLQSRTTATPAARRSREALKSEAAEPIAAPRDPALMASEVAALPPEQRLVSHGEFEVCFARAVQIPHLLHEIGRQREITFRGVAEGTGKALDLDRFDDYYLHLFIWNHEKSEVVGAYRVGLTDEILPRYGVEGLYTSTLFRYDRRVLDQVGPALELGRSFIRPDYQKAYASLLLLWKGIGAFVSRMPRYQVFFGPVSINNKYKSISRQLIMSYLEANNSMPAVAQWVKPKNPPQVRPSKTVDLKECSTVVRDIEEVSGLIAEIEADQKGIPILLKQYLKLGGKILGFNIDPDFGDVLDGLILVDLRQLDVRLLERFAGADGAATILAWGRAHPVRA